MKLLFLSIFTFLIFIVFNSCGDNGIEPNIEPGRRDYEWKEDTLNMGIESLTLTRIWANNPQDVWVLGFGTTAFVEIWHYNGEKWANQNEPKQLNIIQPKAIHGFSSNDVWIGTGENQIWHYNGKSWNLFQTLSIVGYDRITIENIYGNSPNDVYAVGAASNYATSNYTGIILHFNGNKWEFKNIENRKINLSAICYEKNSNLFFLLGTNFDNGNFLDKIFTFDGLELKEISSSLDGYGLGNAGDKVYINSNQKVYKYRDMKLIFWKDFYETNFMTNITGRSENDFINSAYNGIGHYNGSNYETIYKTKLDINGISILEKDLFVITHDQATHKSIIIHGWLE